MVVPRETVSSGPSGLGPEAEEVAPSSRKKRQSSAQAAGMREAVCMREVPGARAIACAAEADTREVACTGEADAREPAGRNCGRFSGSPRVLIRLSCPDGEP